jgi:hypothetical protein
MGNETDKKTDRQQDTSETTIENVLLSSGLDVKQGAIYTKSDGFERSTSIELLEKNGWSLDVGATKSQGFAGISKDILDDNIDVGAGITTKKQAYVGFSVKF